MFIKFLICVILYSVISIQILSIMKRSALTESLLQKYAEDEKHKSNKHESWYKLDMSKLDEKYQDKFVQLHQDSETEQFLNNCYEKSEALLKQLWHSFAIPFLKIFMTQTNVNGYLDRGSMFVYSSAQFHQLMRIDDSWRAESLLDLGAGDGKVTQTMAKNFEEVYATEVASQMQYHLRNKGYTVLDIDGWAHQKYDAITCLNLLDRCDKPLTLLRNIKSALKDDGCLIVASVFPFSPYVEANSTTNYQPKEKLRIESKSIEGQINDMLKNVFEPEGFQLISVSRVPYLCEGDLTTSFYILHDIIFVLKLHT